MYSTTQQTYKNFFQSVVKIWTSAKSEVLTENSDSVGQQTGPSDPTKRAPNSYPPHRFSGDMNRHVLLLVLVKKTIQQEHVECVQLINKEKSQDIFVSFVTSLYTKDHISFSIIS